MCLNDYCCVLISGHAMPAIWFWTYVQPAGSQRSPCVGRCTRAPARCACWLRSGPGPLAAQDRPPLSPPPHRTALLCSSSSGPGAAAAASRARAGGGTGREQRAKTGVETVTEIANGVNIGRGVWGGHQCRQTYACQRCVCVEGGCRSVMVEGSSSVTHTEGKVFIYHDRSN